MSKDIEALIERLEAHVANLREVVRGYTPWLDANDARKVVDDLAAGAAVLRAVQPVQELSMTPIGEGTPVRDQLHGEQTILTYNDRVGTWDIAFMEAGWDDFDQGFALGVTHWVDITGMWPGVTDQVASFHLNQEESRSEESKNG